MVTTQLGVTVGDLAEFFGLIQTEKFPHKLFSINFLSLSTPKRSYVKIGTRTPFVDFPRIAWTVFYNDIHHYCETILKDYVPPDQFREYLKDSLLFRPTDIFKLLEAGVDLIKKEQNNHLSPLYDLSKILTKLEITWSITFQWWYKRPVIRIYTDRYYKTLWMEKIKNFVDLLSRGKDDPYFIYKVSSEMSVEYARYNLNLGLSDFEKRSLIFRILEATPSLSVPRELQKMYKVIEKLTTHLELNIMTEYDLLLQSLYQALISDMKSSVYQLSSIYQSGHYLGGYHLLRHLIQDLGNLIVINFLSSESKRLLPTIYPQDRGEAVNKMKEELNTTWRTLEEYLNEFSSTWINYMVLDLVGIPHIKLLDVDEFPLKRNKWDSTNFDNLIRFYHNGHLKEKIKNYEVPLFTDRVLYESIDAVLKYQMNLQDIISNKNDLQNTSRKLVSVEYSKLSTAVHKPIIVDFPPYSSTIEYLGFLHHLKIVRKIFEDVLKVYRRRISKNIQREEMSRD